MSKASFYTIQEIAEKLHITIGTAYNRIHDSKCDMPPWVKPGAKLLFPIDGYEAWIKELQIKRSGEIQAKNQTPGKRNRGRPTKAESRT